MMFRKQAVLRLTAAAVTVLAGLTTAGRVSAQEAVTVADAAAPPRGAAQHPQEVQITFPRVIVAEVFTGPIVRVVDGATIIVQRDSGRGRTHRETVRLFGLRRSSLGAAAKSPDGSEPARRYLSDNLRGKSVRVEGRRRDRNGTLEAVVTEVREVPRRRLQSIRQPDIQPDMPRGVDAAPPTPPASDTPLNVLLVRLGLARYDASIAAADGPMAKRLAEAEEAARKDKNGVWAKAGLSGLDVAASAALPTDEGR
jgi:endonuclease YncB( thermonuclease family)